jgi:hypothetical protein
MKHESSNSLALLEFVLVKRKAKLQGIKFVRGNVFDLTNYMVVKREATKLLRVQKEAAIFLNKGF